MLLENQIILKTVPQRVYHPSDATWCHIKRAGLKHKWPFYKTLDWYPKKAVSVNPSTCIRNLQERLKQILLPCFNMTVFHKLSSHSDGHHPDHLNGEADKNKKIDLIKATMNHSTKSTLNPSQRATSCNFFRVDEVNRVISQSNT